MVSGCSTDDRPFGLAAREHLAGLRALIGDSYRARLPTPRPPEGGDMAEFDDATTVTRRADGDGFDVQLSERWTIGTQRPNGGYLLAVVARAALEAAQEAGAEQRHVVTANVQFITSPEVGPATVVAEVLRVGRTASQVRARLVQGGRAAVEATFTLGHLAEASSPWWARDERVEVPEESECVVLPPIDDSGPSIRQVATQRFDPAVLGFVDGAPSGRGELRSWFRFADGGDPDPLALLFVVDALPPATFDIVATGWVPTLDLTAYIRAMPAPGPLQVRFRVGLIQDGFADETCEVWDSTGRLVAQSTQLVAIRLPSE